MITAQLLECFCSRPGYFNALAFNNYQHLTPFANLNSQLLPSLRRKKQKRACWIGLQASTRIGHHVHSGYHFNATPASHSSTFASSRTPKYSQSFPANVFDGSGTAAFGAAVSRKLRDLDAGFDRSVYQIHAYRSDRSGSEDSEELQTVLERSSIRTMGAQGTTEQQKQQESGQGVQAGVSGAAGCEKAPVKLKSKLWDVQADACTGVPFPSKF